jgi:hypothetical protein
MTLSALLVLFAVLGAIGLLCMWGCIRMLRISLDMAEDDLDLGAAARTNAQRAEPSRTRARQTAP